MNSERSRRVFHFCQSTSFKEKKTKVAPYIHCPTVSGASGRRRYWTYLTFSGANSSFSRSSAEFGDTDLSSLPLLSFLAPFPGRPLPGTRGSGPSTPEESKREYAPWRAIVPSRRARPTTTSPWHCILNFAFQGPNQVLWLFNQITFANSQRQSDQRRSE
jgi:hypothetical protein